LASVSLTIRANPSSPPNDVVSTPSSTSTVYVNTFAVPSPTFGAAPGTMCQALAPASVNGPPSGRMPVGRFASNCVRPLGGAPMIAVLATPIVGGPCTGPSGVSGCGTLVPLMVW
jgi:hypothetical protein